MRKNFYFMMISIFFLSIGCSSSNETDMSDPVYDAEFTPLQSLSELKSNVWVYEGAKIGDRKFGKISSGSCLANNLLLFKTNSVDLINGMFDYYSYSNSANSACDVSFVNRFVIYRITDNVAWSTYKRLSFIPEKEGSEIDFDIFLTENDGLFPNEDDEGRKSADDESKTVLKKLNIGFQAGFLRIEDKLSEHKGQTVYLYFRKA